MIFFLRIFYFVNTLCLEPLFQNFFFLRNRVTPKIIKDNSGISKSVRVKEEKWRGSRRNSLTSHFSNSHKFSFFITHTFFFFSSIHRFSTSEPFPLTFLFR